MIFVTVGTQLPFPRLIDHMIGYSQRSGERVVLQTGDTADWHGMESYRSLSAPQFEAFVNEARVIVSHAGIGSILAAKSASRPLILLPRRAKLGEHRNDHQLATAAAFKDRAGLRVAWEVDELDNLLAHGIEEPTTERNPRYDGLAARLRDFVSGPGILQH
ncbi:glycosyltransferase [Litoreibacter arenae]|uniref:glycosyltransferase n=1 Tax=Litoreibacter arenae TaxID=491388 RepID=UPI0009F9A26E|nr:glycosyltransferase [Litoreibacter arenae]